MTDDTFIRRILISLDVEDYSSRTDVDQHELQGALADVLAAAAEQAEFDRSKWDIQSAGDGELSVLPMDESEQRVIDKLPQAIASALATHNSTARSELQLRMRLAVHHGLVRCAPGGYAGTGVVTVSRIVDSGVARAALRACPKANLVFLLSTPLYTELVLQRHTRLTSKDFREVPVHTKKFRSTAWLHIPGHDVHGLPLDADTQPADAASTRKPAAEASAAKVHQINVGDVRDFRVEGEMVIGVKNSFTS